eukprot:666490-Amphidinium_carterae.1
MLYVKHEVTRSFLEADCWGGAGVTLCRRPISTFHQSTNRVRALGLPAHINARIVKSLHSIGLHSAEVGGIAGRGMSDLRPSASRTLGK